MSRGECETVLARNVVGRIAFAHQGHVNVVPATYVYAAGWLYARADRALRTAIRHNRWVAVEVAEIEGVSVWRSVVVRGACYATSPNSVAAGDAAMAGGMALLRDKVPEMSREGQTIPFATAIVRVHVDELPGYRATSSAAPRESVAPVRSSRLRGTQPTPPRRKR
jgi:nitroimidazol reductase NimA-like FMN-containing flavoprotein (pyridoxamine 5'-phosphate oxidase superfamily)